MAIDDDGAAILWSTGLTEDLDAALSPLHPSPKGDAPAGHGGRVSSAAPPVASGRFEIRIPRYDSVMPSSRPPISTEAVRRVFDTPKISIPLLRVPVIEVADFGDLDDDLDDDFDGDHRSARPAEELEELILATPETAAAFVGITPPAPRFQQRSEPPADVADLGPRQSFTRGLAPVSEPPPTPRSWLQDGGDVPAHFARIDDAVPTPRARIDEAGYGAPSRLGDTGYTPHARSDEAGRGRRLLRFDPHTGERLPVPVWAEDLPRRKR